MDERRRAIEDRQRGIGILAALGAFVIWGFVPMYFKALETVDAGVIIGHRIVWSLVLILGWQALRHRRRLLQALALPPRTAAMLAVSGTLVALNWLTFVWAVTHEKILATSLGYFINPLVNVALGMIFLRERLDRRGWVALALATAGTAYLGWRLGEPPWVALILALSFGAYGLTRKVLDAGPLTGLWWECLWLTLPALVYLHRIVGTTLNPLAPFDAPTSALLVGAGLVTLVPLALFALAARRLPLSTVGFFQYLAPSISFLLAVAVYHEPFTRHHAVAFGLIWAALAVFTWRPTKRTGNVRR